MINQDRVFINDVGPRDGLQNQKVLVSVTDRFSLIQKLADAKLSGIEVGAFVSPKAVPAMAGTDQLFRQLGTESRRQDLTYSALIPNQKGFQLATVAGARTVSLVVAASDTMNQKNIGMSTQSALAVCKQIIAASADTNVKVQVYLATAWACPFEGQMSESSVLSVASELFSLGANNLVIADTIGAAHPKQVVSLMKQLSSIKSAEHFACHFHDTRAMGLANVYAAVECGIRHFDASIAGLGGCPFAPGASGNVATEDVVFMCEQMGLDSGVDLKRLVVAAEFAMKIAPSAQGGNALGYIKQFIKED